jgi:hypothetical protein
VPGRVTFRLRPLPAPADAGALPHGSARRVLCVGHVMPYPPRAGNEYRIHRLLSWLVQQGFDLLLVVCPARLPSEEQMVAAAAVYPNIVICARDGTLYYRLAGGGHDLETLAGGSPSAIAALLHEDDRGEPAQARMLDLQRRFCPDVLVELLRHLDRTWSADVLLAQYVFMTRAFPLLRADLLKIVDTIDVFSTKASKVELHGVSDGLSMTEAEERALLRRADVLIAIQPEEAAALSRLSPGAEIVNAGVDFPEPMHASGAPAGATLLLVASDNPLNVKGLEDFLRLAWPQIRRAVPAAELRVVGSIGAALAAVPDGVQVLGPLEHLHGEYARARVAINPAIAGTGLKIKTLEALCHLRPVVSWPAGVEGIGPDLKRFCRVAGDWPDFVRHVVSLLTDTTTVVEMHDDRRTLARLCSADIVYAELGRVLTRDRARRRSVAALWSRLRRWLEHR